MTSTLHLGKHTMARRWSNMSGSSIFICRFLVDEDKCEMIFSSPDVINLVCFEPEDCECSKPQTQYTQAADDKERLDNTTW